MEEQSEAMEELIATLTKNHTRQIEILINSISAKSILAGEKLVATYSISM
jgi:hypothetical protein